MKSKSLKSKPQISDNKISSKIDSRLNELFPNPPIPLDHTDSFTLLVAVILSAQSTDKKVNEITPLLFAKANTPQKMISLGEKEILKIIRPIGLSPQKAKSLFKMSQQLVEKHNGQVPQTFEELEELAGVGHKTASVLMAQSFGVPAFPVDTHIHRLAQVWGLTNGKNVTQTELDLKKAFPKERWNELHLQIIYYGRTHCQARGCDGLRCSLCKELFPQRTKPVTPKK